MPDGAWERQIFSPLSQISDPLGCEAVRRLISMNRQQWLLTFYTLFSPSFRLTS